MLDKVYIRSENEAFLIFTDRPPIRISSDVNVLLLLEFLLGWPITSTHHLLEDTVEIDISKLAV